MFVGHASGELARRPESDKATSCGPDDALVIKKLDRLGRSVGHLVDLCQPGERGTDLRVIDQGIDTSTPSGKLTFHVLAAIAEFERDLISEGTLDGLDAARARGRKGGRSSKLATAWKLSDAKAERRRRRRPAFEPALCSTPR